MVLFFVGATYTFGAVSLSHKMDGVLQGTLYIGVLELFTCASIRLLYTKNKNIAIVTSVL